MDGTRQLVNLLVAVLLISTLALPLGVLGHTADTNRPADEDEGNPLQVEYTVGFVTAPAGLEVEIDGIPYTTPVEFLWEEGTVHMIGAPSPQDGGYRVQYSWTHWPDGGTQVHPITVAEDVNYTAFYDTQYLLTVDTEPTGLWMDVDGVPRPTPIQFWASADTVMILSAPPLVEVDNETRYVFLYWKADPWIPVPLNEPTIMFTVTSPQNLTAVYELQYRLRYEAPWDIPSEWFGNGTIAYAGLDSPYNYTSQDTRYAFVGWGGNASGTDYSQSDPILMDGPKTAVVLWTREYRLTFGDFSPMPQLIVIVDGVNYTMPATFWWEHGSTHTIEVPDQQIGPTTLVKFAGWLSGDCLWSPCILTIWGPGYYLPVWTLQYLATVETSPSGLSFSLDGIEHMAPESFWLDEGSVHLLETSSPQSFSAGEAYAWQSWSDGGGIAHDITVYMAATYTAFFDTQYEISFLGPADLEVRVDDVPYTMPFSFWCDEGSTHVIYFPSPQAVGPQSRAAFVSWTHPDFLGNPATIVCDKARSTSVVVMLQHMVNISSNPAGMMIEVDGLPIITPHTRWWDDGSSHHLYAPDCPPDCWWHNWSDGGEQAHDIIVTGPMTYTANYMFGMQVTVTTHPLVPVVEVDGMQYEPPATFMWEYNTLHTINAPSPQVTPNGTLEFSHWSDGGARSHTIVVDGTEMYTAYYTGIVEVMIDTMPVPLQVYVDGVPHTAPKSFLWAIGSWHTIEAPEEQSAGPNASWQFSQWSDGGERNHSIEILGPEAYIAHYDKFYRVTADTAPSGLNMSVDGTILSTPSFSWWKEGSDHELEAISPQEMNDTRYLFIRWADGHAFPKRTVTVSGADTYVAIYKPYYYLSVIVPEPPISIGPIEIGAGWYEEGSLAIAGLAVSEVEYETGRRWAFRYWGGDASGTDYSASYPILMDRSKTALVVWKTQFLLTVESEYGTPTGAGWFDEGALAVVTIEEEVSVGGKVWRFQGWSGDVSSQSSQVVVLMDSPALLRAHWSEVTEEPAEDYFWPILYVATTATLVSALVLTIYLLKIRPGRRGTR